MWIRHLPANTRDLSVNIPSPLQNNLATQERTTPTLLRLALVCIYQLWRKPASSTLLYTVLVPSVLIRSEFWLRFAALADKIRMRFLEFLRFTGDRWFMYLHLIQLTLTPAHVDFIAGVSQAQSKVCRWFPGNTPYPYPLWMILQVRSQVLDAMLLIRFGWSSSSTCSFCHDFKDALTVLSVGSLFILQSNPHVQDLW